MDISSLSQKVIDKSLKIGVFGLGRIGLPTALIYTRQFKVIGMDINLTTLENLKKGETFIDEPGLDTILKNAIDKNLIEFTSEVNYVVENADIFLTCVPTPITKDMSPDYSYIIDVATKVGKKLKKGQIFIMESSVSPTTIENLIIPILEKESNMKCNEEFGVCSCPERADPGKIVQNFDTVNRIVGGTCKEVTKLIADVYRAVTKAQVMEVSSPSTANAIKLTENIFRDVNIALMNEFAILYERLGIDIKEVIKGSATKYNFVAHYPGPGVGGPCLPANPYYIIDAASKVNYIPFLIRVAREVNDRMPLHVRDLVIEAYNEAGLSLKDSTITVLGLSYKANVRDIQISPSIKVLNFLMEMKQKIKVFDPFYVNETVNSCYVEKTIEDAMQGTDGVVVLTDHKEFFDLDFAKLMKENKNLILIDSRNIYEMDKLPKGMIYVGVGRPLVRISKK